MLDRLFVLDLTNYLPGPYATLTLADFGARVIKVESLVGDPVRHIPPHDAAGVSGAFRALNQGKQSLALDLKKPEGLDLLLRLAKKADVLVEGFRPGVLDRLGISYEACRVENPRLVWCSITGYGQDGPYRDRAGHDVNYLSYSGALGITCDASGTPVIPGLQAADTLASLAALSGILLALLEREGSGQGRRVDSSMLDAAVSVQGIHFASHVLGQRAGPRQMTLNGGFPCYATYTTKDGRGVALGALEPKFWEAFCEVVGKDDWTSRHFDVSLRDDVAALFASRDLQEWRVILENAECCFSPALTYDETMSDPQVQARGLIEESRVAPPIRFDPPLRRRGGTVPERPGADTRMLLNELLGLSDEEIDALAQGGAIGL